MAKSRRKRSNGVVSGKEHKNRIAKNAQRTVEKVDSLLELHKLQGVLLTQLRKDIGSG